MPRSNKKKHPLKPPPKHPSSEEIVDRRPEISQIILNERTDMMKRAIHSAKHHGINLKPGTPTPGRILSNCGRARDAFTRTCA